MLRGWMLARKGMGMRGRRTRRLECESLERRSLLFGFVQPVMHMPLYLDLAGAARGTVLERAVSGPSLKLNVRGPISPLGPTTLLGTLHAAGSLEEGTLLLESPQNSLKIRVVGPALSSASSAPTQYQFTILQGSGMLPSSDVLYLREEGAGSIDLTIAPGTGRVGASLVFEKP